MFRSSGLDVPVRAKRLSSSFRQQPAVATAICLLCLLGWAQAWAGAPTDQLKASVDHVIAVLQDPNLKSDAKAAERRAAIRQQAESEFDFNETAKRALGRHWQELSESQRKEFVSLFADLIERAYITKIEKYSGEPIVYVGESVEGDTATVRTKFVTKQGTEIPIDYRLFRNGDRWLVYDVLVEGVSLVANYRTQFDRILRTSGYEELVRRMKSAEFGTPEKSRTPRS